MQQNADRQTPIEEMQERIETFLLDLRRPVLSEPGKDFVDLAASNYSFVSQYNKLLWHVWNDHTNLVRQITGIQKETPNRMELRYQKFGKGAPGSLIVADSRARSEHLERKSARALFAQSLKRYLSQLSPGWKIEELHTEPDLHRSLSGLYARGLLAKGPRTWAVIGCGEHEDAQTTESILTYGLLWLDWLRGRETGTVCEGLKIFLPPERSNTTLQRLSAMNPSIVKWEIYETGEPVTRMDRQDIGNLRTRFATAFHLLIPRKPISHEQTDLTVKICEMNPEIEVGHAAGDRWVFSLNGLSFARESQDGIVFGVGRAQTPLDKTNFDRLGRLVKSITRIRNTRSGDPNHPFYRLQPERWMQSALIRQIELLGIDLDPELLYEQVPAASGLQHGLIDLLGITSRGRLVVAEFKASEDIHLPLQALDYWMRVRWQQQTGELQRMGYFQNRAISPDAPLLALVSPALQFHSTADSILKYFSPEIDVVKIGLNEDWRSRIQVLFRNRRGDS